jgi:hypothetical protein
MAWMSFRVGRMRVSNRGVSARVGRVRVGQGWPRAGRGRSGGGLLALIAAFVSDRPVRTPSLEELPGAPDGTKKRAWVAKTAQARATIGEAAFAEERAAIDAMSDAEVEAGLAADMWNKKRSSKTDFELFLASLPSDSRAIIERVMREHPT